MVKRAHSPTSSASSATASFCASDLVLDFAFFIRCWDGELCRRDQIRNPRLLDLGRDVMRFRLYQVRDDLELCLSKVETWLSVPN